MIERTYAVRVAVADHDRDLLDRVVPAAIRDRLGYTAARVVSIEEVTNGEVSDPLAGDLILRAAEGEVGELELVPATPEALAEAVRATEAARDAGAEASASA